ncbi:hypothetical protein ISF_02653 [Cordyceps fumosorosea ARSEF 2679]|uniref:Uncharacterized protein n=1 Tax=Cordyceps fumosorosea (strain ARSEF 2679) TaxID=1081104 RepID=A0A162MUI4_CORFA|nr:hypothetical protein ISF_02653 [Cordyceps fumosorosea ARSEF 2679]OAA70679.1 hypothetical protein ISF_02653 [Cordyceps fumosorosea ARSEF 2679]
MPSGKRPSMSDNPGSSSSRTALPSSKKSKKTQAATATPAQRPPQQQPSGSARPFRTIAPKPLPPTATHGSKELNKEEPTQQQEQCQLIWPADIPLAPSLSLPRASAHRPRASSQAPPPPATADESDKDEPMQQEQRELIWPAERLRPRHPRLEQLPPIIVARNEPLTPSLRLAGLATPEPGGVFLSPGGPLRVGAAAGLPSPATIARPSRPRRCARPARDVDPPARVSAVRRMSAPSSSPKPSTAVLATAAPSSPPPPTRHEPPVLHPTPPPAAPARCNTASPIIQALPSLRLQHPFWGPDARELIPCDEAGAIRDAYRRERIREVEARHSRGARPPHWTVRHAQEVCADVHRMPRSARSGFGDLHKQLRELYALHADLASLHPPPWARPGDVVPVTCGGVTTELPRLLRDFVCGMSGYLLAEWRPFGRSRREWNVDSKIAFLEDFSCFLRFHNKFYSQRVILMHAPGAPGWEHQGELRFYNSVPFRGWQERLETGLTSEERSRDSFVDCFWDN